MRSARRARRAAALLAAGALGGLQACTGGPAAPKAVYPAAPAAVHRMPLGPPLPEPEQYSSRQGLLRVHLTVQRRQVEVGGRRLWALTYNGRYMPPTLRIRPGDRLELALRNGLPQYTNLHVHGLLVSPSDHADNIFVHIRPGETFHYSYRFPLALTPGTYWYHSHAHPLSAPQVAGGLSGLIVVGGLRRHLPPALRRITEHVIALKDDQVQGDAIKTSGLRIGSPTQRTVNGLVDPVIRIRPGETQLWRLANIGANIYYRLHLTGGRFTVIAQDGSPVRRIRTADELLMPAGARYDVLVHGGPPGRTELQTLPYRSGPGGNLFPQATLASVLSQGAPASSRLPAPGTPFAAVPDLGTAHVAARRTFVYSENAAGTVFYINGRTFDPNRVDVRSRLNTVEEWTFRNASTEDHSLHVHVDHFQLMSVDGRPVDSDGLQDTVNVPAGGRITVRIRFAYFTGRTVLHCHILNHEDAGMMAVLRIDP